MRLLVLLLTGCAATTVDPCAGESGTCLALQVRGAIAQLDTLELDITVNGQLGHKTAASPDGRPRSLPLAVGIVFDNPPAGELAIHVDGHALLASLLVGEGGVGASLPSGRHGTVTLELFAPGTDLAAPLPDLVGADFSGVDFSGPDLAGVDFSDVDFSEVDGGCVHLQCQIPDCDGGTTSISGTVLTPSGADPVYNATVYVPNTTLSPVPQGAFCGTCASYLSGSPIVSTLTSADGSFTLSGVPAGSNIPLVIQIGRWRREIIIPAVAACGDTPLDPTQTRLPRNHIEGNIPLFAIATGSADPMECLLRRMGIEDAEFSGPATGAGRIHFYPQNGASVTGSGLVSAMVNGAGNYDVVILACEGQQITKQASDVQKLVDYVKTGGRIFANHYEYTWLYQSPDLMSVVQWNVDQPFPTPSPFPALLDQTFPKGAAVAAWLVGNGAWGTSPSPIPLTDPRHDVDGVNSGARRWVYGTSPAMTQMFTVDLPVGTPCGRVVFSDFHTGQQGINTSGKPFPTECTSDPLSTQEKVLMFQLMDLTGCL